MSDAPTRPCEKCPTGTAIGKHARLCDPCRAQVRRRPPKYVFTPELEEALRKVYETRERLSQGLRRLSRETGWPAHAFRKRAQEMGIARVKEKPWSPAELALLEQHGWKCPGRLREILRRAGYVRSETSIAIKRKRLRLVQNAPGYSANALAGMLGVDSHKVTRWIAFGWLKAERRGTERTKAQGGDSWFIGEAAVRKFVLAHPLEISPGRADWLWLLDLVTGGKVGAGQERADRGDDAQEAA